MLDPDDKEDTKSTEGEGKLSKDTHLLDIPFSQQPPPRPSNNIIEVTYAQRWKIYPNGTMFPFGMPFPIGKARVVAGKKRKKKGTAPVVKLNTGEEY